ncbi:hypothetical protein Misp01_47620 [Microtetraspora sp. NBRC 13810]|uniref:hypothetical protein n=1 Tax=Microtetraspora sp. NBRC 13810 TaxID=3030990 RepID=UPI0024A20B66|nr:hypothetical protein [Microtetraspora sp. NBRC 13810]GLW09633.1 hypothetical protein Misp01_47620 [Microtetraspora sp. NBRC 13810]
MPSRPEGENAEGSLAFEEYQQLYVGGVAGPSSDGDWKLWDAAEYERIYDFD